MRKSAKGTGTIRKKTVTRGGKEYTYWEARVTTGRDSGTGKQIQRSFTGKTQREVREKMQAAAVEVNQGRYTAPSKLTVGQWLDIWQRDYLGSLKPCTVRTYRTRSQVKECFAPEDEKMAFSRSGACRTPAAALLTRYPLQGAHVLLFAGCPPGVPKAKMVEELEKTV